MGRKKSRKKPPPKKKITPIPSLFDCPFCMNSGSVECSILRNIGQARIKCQVCDEKWSTSNVTELTANVDVYNEWIDCCEAENQAAEREGEGGDEGDLDNFVI